MKPVNSFNLFQLSYICNLWHNFQLGGGQYWVEVDLEILV